VQGLLCFIRSCHFAIAFLRLGLSINYSFIAFHFFPEVSPDGILLSLSNFIIRRTKDYRHPLLPNNLSTFNIKDERNISVNMAISATTQMGPIDAALNNNSKYLYVLNAVSHSIGVYEVANTGGLSNVQTLQGVPAGATGLAAR